MILKTCFYFNNKSVIVYFNKSCILFILYIKKIIWCSYFIDCFWFVYLKIVVYFVLIYYFLSLLFLFKTVAFLLSLSGQKYY